MAVVVEVDAETRPALWVVTPWRAPRLDRWQTEPAVLVWVEESQSQRQRRRRYLRYADVLLQRIEDANATAAGAGSGAPAPLRLVRAYAALGGVPLWAGPWPNGAELHEAVLELQYGWMRPLQLDPVE